MIPTPVVRKTLGQITDEGIMNRQESSKIINRIKQSAKRLVNGLLKYPYHVPDLELNLFCGTGDRGCKQRPGIYRRI